MLTLSAVHPICVVEHSAMWHSRCSICSYLRRLFSQAKVAYTNFGFQEVTTWSFWFILASDFLPVLDSNVWFIGLGCLATCDGNNGSPKTVLHCLAWMGSGTSVQGKCCSYTGLRWFRYTTSECGKLSVQQHFGKLFNTLYTPDRIAQNHGRKKIESTVMWNVADALKQIRSKVPSDAAFPEPCRSPMLCLRGHGPNIRCLHS